MSPTGAFIRPFRLFNGAKRSSHKCNHPTTVRPNVCLSLVTFHHTCFCELPNHWHWHCEFKCVCASLLIMYYFVSVLPCFLRSGTFWDPIVITRRTYENVYFFGGREKKRRKKTHLPAHQNASWHTPAPQRQLLAAAACCWCWKIKTKSSSSVLKVHKPRSTLVVEIFCSTCGEHVGTADISRLTAACFSGKKTMHVVSD